MKKFTFKTIHPTGRYRAFDEDEIQIKLNKIIVGEIDYKVPYKIRLMITKEDLNEDKNPNCTWKWITLKKGFSSINEAKQFIVLNNDQIQQQFNLVK